MRSPSRAHPRHIPMVPAGPHWSDGDQEGGLYPNPSGEVSWLQLSSSSPPLVPRPTQRARTAVSHTAGTAQGHGLGVEAEHRLHFRHGPPTPLGKRDVVSRVWAFSPPGTTEWAVFGRQVSGAWSVA